MISPETVFCRELFSPVSDLASHRRCRPARSVDGRRCLINVANKRLASLPSIRRGLRSPIDRSTDEYKSNMKNSILLRLKGLYRYAA